MWKSKVPSFTSTKTKITYRVRQHFSCDSKNVIYLIMKPLGTRWITSAYDYLRSQTGIVRGGFSAAGIVEILESDEVEDIDAADSDEDPFQDLD